MTIWGGLLIVAALLALVGASLGYGSGVMLGFTLLPVALLCFAAGVVGGAVVDARLHGVVRVLALALAACASVLALVGSLSALEAAPVRAISEWLLRPTFIALLVAMIAFVIVGALARDLPAIPASAVATGALLLSAGLVGQERVADIGFWVTLAGWAGLGASPWGGG
jgi:hypothetical protein